MVNPGASDNAFTHEPLPDPAKYIRLLELLDDDYSKTIKVRCRLTTWPIDRVPPYHAISYTWGDAKSNTTILMNDKPLQVRTNCEFALKQAYWYRKSYFYFYRKRQFRWYEQSRASWYSKSQYFWLDAICIDQMNIGEKSKQVAMMGSIYKNASRVLACIGDHADDSLFFFQSLYGVTHYVVRPRHMLRYQRSFGGVALRFRMLHRYSTTHRFALALARLAIRPYFARMWILQELQLAQHITILCGKYVLPHDDALYLFGGLLDDLQRLEPEENSDKVTIVPAHHYFIDHRFFRRHVNHGFPLPAWYGDWMYQLPKQCMTTLVMLRQNYQTVKDNIFLLFREVVCRLQCADPRDKIYGIISLIDWGNVTPLEPDYAHTDVEVATKFIEAMMKLEETQDIGAPIWKYVVITIKLLSLNNESRGMAEALQARHGALEDCAEGAALMPTGSSTVLVQQYGWRLSQVDIDKNTSKLQDLEATPPKYSTKDVFYLPKWSRANDWVIELETGPVHDLWYDIFDDNYHQKSPHHMPLLVMREGNDGRNALIGHGFHCNLIRSKTPWFKEQDQVDVDVYFDIEDAVVFLWRLKQLYELPSDSKDWMGPLLGSGICKKQAPGSSYAVLPTNLPLSLTAERVDYGELIMPDRHWMRYHSLRETYFVLFDTKAGRGWLVNGEVVALELLRAYLRNTPQIEPFDFSKLEYMEANNPGALQTRLNDWKDRHTPIFRVVEDVGEMAEDRESFTTRRQPNVERKVIGKILEDFYETLLDIHDKRDPFPGEAHYFFGMEITTEKHRNTIVKGWDFERMYRTNKPKVCSHVFTKNPIWHGFVKLLHAPFIFGSDFGELIQPDDQRCPYFKTLPKHQDYLAVGMDTIQSRVNQECGDFDINETVARLTRKLAWEYGVDPFGHTHGQEDHLEQVNSKCFPVQRLVKVPMLLDRKDKDVLQREKGRPYSWKEADDVNTAPEDMHKPPGDKPFKTGMVVFGKIPNQKKLSQLAKANLHEDLPLGDHKQLAQP